MANATDKIKLLIITPTLRCGGSEKHVAMVCNTIDPGRFDTVLVVTDNSEQFYPIINTAIEVTDLRIKKLRHALFALKKIIAEKQPHIVYSTANHVNLALATFRWLFPKRIHFIARESSIVSINSRRSGIPAYTQLVKRFYRRLDHIICQSVAMQHDLADNFGIPRDKLTVIHNAVSEKQDTSPANGREPYTFITVARLSEEKGLERLIDAVAKLPFSFNYYIIGSGPLQQSLAQLVQLRKLQDKVFLIPEKEEPFRGMEAADLFLSGSYYEGFPNAVLEATALGIPVIAFPGEGGTAEIIMNGVNGYLAGKDENFTSMVEKALTHPFDRAAISRDTIAAFSVPVMMKKLEALFARFYHLPCP